MEPSKKKPKIQMTKPPKLVSSPPTEPDMHQISTLTSTSQSSSSDLSWLSDAFSSLSVDQIELAYDEAGCDTFKAAGILGTHLEVEQEEEYGCNTGPTAKDYTGSHSKSNDKIRTDAEEAEGFLRSMLGEISDLGMGVVRDILGKKVPLPELKFQFRVLFMACTYLIHACLVWHCLYQSVLRTEN